MSVSQSQTLSLCLSVSFSQSLSLSLNLSVSQSLCLSLFVSVPLSQALSLSLSHSLSRSPSVSSCFKKSLRLFQECLQNVSRKLQWSFKQVSREVQEGSSKFQECYMEITRWTKQISYIGSIIIQIKMTKPRQLIKNVFRNYKKVAPTKIKE